MQALQAALAIGSPELAGLMEECLREEEAQQELEVPAAMVACLRHWEGSMSPGATPPVPPPLLSFARARGIHVLQVPPPTTLPAFACGLTSFLERRTVSSLLNSIPAALGTDSRLHCVPRCCGLIGCIDVSAELCIRGRRRQRRETAAKLPAAQAAAAGNELGRACNASLGRWYAWCCIGCAPRCGAGAVAGGR